MLRSRSFAVSAGLVLGLSLSVGSAVGQTAQDSRTVVTLPAPVAEVFRAEMRGHMRSLDDVLYALAEGNYDEAATLADIRWDFGHRMWEGMEEQGMTPEEIAQAKQRMRDAMGGAGMMGRGMGQGMGQGMGMGMGMGRFMPEAFRMMGQGFHEAGQRFAAKARAIGDAPTLDDQRALLGALQEVTSTCRACHEAFRVVAEGEDG